MNLIVCHSCQQCPKRFTLLSCNHIVCQYCWSDQHASDGQILTYLCSCGQRTNELANRTKDRSIRTTKRDGLTLEAQIQTASSQLFTADELGANFNARNIPSTPSGDNKNSGKSTYQRYYHPYSQSTTNLDRIYRHFDQSEGNKEDYERKKPFKQTVGINSNYILLKPSTGIHKKSKNSRRADLSGLLTASQTPLQAEEQSSSRYGTTPNLRLRLNQKGSSGVSSPLNRTAYCMPTISPFNLGPRSLNQQLNYFEFEFSKWLDEIQGLYQQIVLALKEKFSATIKWIKSSWQSRVSSQLNQELASSKFEIQNVFEKSITCLTNRVKNSLYSLLKEDQPKQDAYQGTCIDTSSNSYQFDINSPVSPKRCRYHRSSPKVPFRPVDFSSVRQKQGI